MNVKTVTELMKLKVSIDEICIPNSLSEAIADKQRIPLSCIETENVKEVLIDGHSLLDVVAALDEGIEELCQSRSRILDRWQDTIDDHLDEAS